MIESHPDGVQCYQSLLAIQKSDKSTGSISVLPKSHLHHKTIISFVDFSRFLPIFPQFPWRGSFALNESKVTDDTRHGRSNCRCHSLSLCERRDRHEEDSRHTRQGVS